MTFTEWRTWPVRMWRHSLVYRSVLTVAVLLSIVVVAISAFMAYTIRTDLFESRLDQAIADSNRAAVQAQSTLSSSVPTNQSSVQSLLNAVLGAVENATSSHQVALLRSPNSAPGVTQDVMSANLVLTEIPAQLRASVRNDPGSVYWQSIRQNSGAPGIVTGVSLSVPVAGTHELYVVFDLSSEEATLNVVRQTLLSGGIAMVLLGAIIVWGAIGSAMLPVTEAARTSSRLAEGDLEERIPVKGENELATLASSFNSMADALQHQITELADLSKMQQRFVSDVSHELRTPLTTIKLATDLVYARRGNLGVDGKRSAELLHDQVERFEDLLADLLEISRYDARAATLDTRPVDLDSLVMAELSARAPLASQHGCELRFARSGGDPVVEGDSKRITRIVRNLLANAIEHGEGKPIVVVVAATKAEVSIVVIDHGVGIAAEDQRKVFDRFWRGDPSRKRTIGGTGLGLSIAREDARLHHGSLEVWSRLGHGTQFRLTLPRTFDEPIADPLPSLPVDESTIASEYAGGLR